MNLWRKLTPDELAREFLPAALEIQATPPSPIGRAVLWSIVALLSLALVWAVIGSVDIVAVARGKVVPVGGVKSIQPMATSTVRAINVRNGQTVRAGEVLVTLDPTLATADATKLSSELASAQQELARYRALRVGIPQGLAALPASPRGVGGDQLQQDLLAQSYAAFQFEIGVLDQAAQRAQATATASQAQVDKLAAILPLVSERLDGLRKLAGSNLVSRSQLLELEQQKIEVESDLTTQRSAAEAAVAEQSGLVARRQQVVANFSRDVLGRIEVLERQVAQLSQEVVKAEQIRSQQTLTSPVDGVVQQLSVFTVGGVVSPAQQLMVIVPNEATLEVEAYIENKDIGFVRESQQAQVKVDSFPFTRYGLIDGVVATVSDDAVMRENVGLIYNATVRIGRTSFMVDGREVPLSPGMAVTVEVKTGTRRLIEYFLAPLIRVGSEAARER